MADGLIINSFGGFMLKYKDAVIGPGVSNSKSGKMWLLLAYLLINNNRKISQDELIEVLWPDMSVRDPANSLKALAFKLRQEIDTLEFIPGKDIILSENGSYSFNDKIDYTLDVNLFDDCIKNSDLCSDEGNKELDYLLQAVGLFKGVVLSELKAEPWLVTVRTHYNELYKNSIKRSAVLLEAQKDFKTIIEICKNAVLIQPYEENYYYHMIKAYAATEDYSAASQIYGQLKSMMDKEYGIIPNTNFEEAYKELMKYKPKKNVTVNQLTEKLRENVKYVTSFYVEYGEFKQVYRLRARMLQRDKSNAYLCLYTLGVEKGTKVSPKSKSENMRVLGEALAFTLRQGDVFTQATPNQFAVILSDIQEKNVVEISKRISKYFAENKKNKHFAIIYTMEKISPVEIE